METVRRVAHELAAVIRTQRLNESLRDLRSHEAEVARGAVRVSRSQHGSLQFIGVRFRLGQVSPPEGESSVSDLARFAFLLLSDRGRSVEPGSVEPGKGEDAPRRRGEDPKQLLQLGPSESGLSSTTARLARNLGGVFANP